MNISRPVRLVLTTTVALGTSVLIAPALSSAAAVAAPPAVRQAAVFGTGHDLRLTWVNPVMSAFTGVTARYSTGPLAPAAPNRGTPIALPAAKSTYAVLTGLAANTRYSIAIWTHDGAQHYSPAVVTRFTTPATRDPNGSVGGTVTDSLGHPLLGVRVSAESQAGPTGTRRTTTDAAGHYSFSLPPGAYFLGFDGALASGGNSDVTGYLSNAASAVITPGGTHADVDTTLQPGAAISGTVTDLDGHPLAGVTPSAIPVLPYVNVTGPFGFAIDFGATAVEPSTADGTFVLKGLAPGPLRLCMDTTSAAVTGGDSDLMGYLPHCATRSVLTVRNGVPASVDMSLEPNPGGVLAGTVRDPAGRPIAGAFVSADSPDEFSLAGGVTRADGTYRLAVSPGHYRVCADAGQTAASSRTAPACLGSALAVHRGTVVTADVVLARGASAAGVVRGPNGGPVPNADVLVESSGPSGGSGSFATTDRHGQFVATGLAPGAYTVCYSSGALTASQPTGLAERCSRIRYMLRAALTRYGLEATLSPGGAIYGRVSDDLGAPVGFSFVDVQPTDPRIQFDSYWVTELADGRYAITGLPAGDYIVCFQSADLTSLGGDRCFGAPASHPERGTPVHVDLGKITSGIDVQIPSGGSITVTTTDTQGRPIGGVDVAAVAACNADVAFCTNLPLFGTQDVSVDASDTTSSAGSVTLTGLRPGMYAICLFAYYGATAVHDSPTGYADSCGGSTYDVTVADHQTTTVHRQLDQAGAVSGTITDTHGAPLAGVHVVVSNAATADYLAVDEFDTPYGQGGPIDDTTTDAHGHYLVHGVPSGGQTVCVDASGAVGGSSAGGYLDGCVLGPDATPKAVPVAAGTTLGSVNLALVSGAAISGAMKNSAGHPIRDGIALAFDVSGNEIGDAVPGSGGTYRITRLPAHTYRVCFVAYRYQGQCFNRVAWNADKGASIPAAAAKLTVSAGAERKGVNAVLVHV